MSSPSSNSLNSTSFTTPTRAEGALPGLMRGNKPTAEAGDRFAQLMKSYGGAQATPPKSEASLQAPLAETIAKPAAPPAVRPPSEGKTEQQRQEERLAQKKITPSNETKPRAPTPGQAQKSMANAAVKGEVEKHQSLAPESNAQADSSERAEQASSKKSKVTDLAESSAVADPQAQVSASQQATGDTALLALANSDPAAATQSADSQGSLDNGQAALALEAAADKDAVSNETGAKPATTAMAASSARLALHTQQSPTSSAQQTSKQTGASPTAELAQSVAGNFGRELQAVQGEMVNSQAAGKSTGFAFEGLMSAAGVAAPTSFEARSEAPAPTQLSISQALTDPGFAPEMAARISVLAADGVQEARLHLNPAEMGPVSVQIIVEGQQAQVSFHAEHEQTRAVLEQSLPDLAAALRDSGLTLSGGGVFQQSRDQANSQQQDPDSSSARDSSRGNSLNLVGSGPVVAPLARPSRGVVDLYA
jgi:flagellar hook-length control protein FliK